jgi:hypothetical protein
MRIVTGVGCVTAALLLAGPARGQMSGGTGSFSGGGGSSGGSGGGSGGGGGTGSSASNVSGSIQSQQLSQGITADSLLGSFNNVGTGTMGRGGSSAVSSANPLAAYYYNPLAQGLVSGTGTGSTTGNAAAFGTPTYGNMTSGSGSLGGRSTGSAFGGTSSSGLGSFGSVGSTASRTGSTGSLSGTATIRGGTTGTIAPGFTGGTWGPAIGRRGPVMAASLARVSRPIPVATRRPDLQAIIARSTRLTSAAGITVATEGNTVVLTGTVASEDDRRIAENMLRLHPGVVDIRNQLTVGPPPPAPGVGGAAGPQAPAPAVGSSASPGPPPGPAPIAPPPGA